MVSKQFTAMTRCFYCGEGANILIHKQLRDISAAHDKVHDMQPCSKCEGYMRQGVILIGISDEKSDRGWQHPGEVKVRDRHGRMTTVRGIPNPFRTGAFMVVSEDFIRRAFNPPELVSHVLRCRWAFIEHEALFKLGILEHIAQQAGKPYRVCECTDCHHHWCWEVKTAPETPNAPSKPPPLRRRRKTTPTTSTATAEDIYAAQTRQTP
ncbi:MAG: hypothetical protein BWY85_00039 [Firmicutes bacterium ADurb.Bin506]|nr:MAG: hypothetical protein BWY85_00039 [Firmicutes bacterium ADurb.Bin506]